jgi:hypothetical protein
MKRSFVLLIVTCFLLIVAAGCTSSTGTSAAATPTVTAVPVTSIPVTTQIPATTDSITTTATSKPAVVSTTASATDPILHRWVRQYPSLTSAGWVAYEFKFYPDGSLVYNFGTPKMTAGNIQVVSTYEATGTWVKSGNNTYLLHYLPLGRTGAQIVDEYTWVPETIDKEYGRTIPEHIISQDEIDEYAHSAREIMADEMMYPERAKVD